MTIPTGVLPVLATPFAEDGSIDEESLHRQIDFVIDNGAHGVVLGMVSEVLRLSEDERAQLTTLTCKAVARRVTVTTSVGAESTHTAAGFARQAAAAGADAVMAIPPMGTACDDDQLFGYFSAIVDAVDVPVVVQDASGYLGRPLSIELQARLFGAFGDRVLFKPEAQPIGPRLSSLLAATDGAAKVYEGTGGLALVDSHRRGITGTMPGPDIVWALSRLWHALETGDQSTVDTLQGPMSALVSLQNSLDSFVAVQKHLLVRQGVIRQAIARGPVGYLLDEQTAREVDRLYDVLATAAGYRG
ncbi:dihydrodipicolinate synthase family protein [Amycolatopsis pithecellobii]|uniref:Dihydrodipicolinate synthase family protein n=1 Tax=Amycolatopsis pithecellobii TaxID=664692 RepID=A0A6N7Z9W1_9PSEU|nr:dihydrodipicolinate synthase family protein [Amycolatopsis pithecellobii]MTD58528.1 dihydrodipicolinate synthase family protein [Amycolatopsis pithecellobii]